jgi:hypothetical protein
MSDGTVLAIDEELLQEQPSVQAIHRDESNSSNQYYLSSDDLYGVSD